MAAPRATRPQHVELRFLHDLTQGAGPGDLTLGLGLGSGPGDLTLGLGLGSGPGDLTQGLSQGIVISLKE